MDLVSIQREIALVGGFYQRCFNMPENPGFVTALGVIEALKRDQLSEKTPYIDSEI
jgi:hypothetical protein